MNQYQGLGAARDNHRSASPTACQGTRVVAHRERRAPDADYENCNATTCTAVSGDGGHHKASGAGVHHRCARAWTMEMILGVDALQIRASR
jgi:hypothetical protein